MSTINTGILATMGPATRKQFAVSFNSLDVGLTDKVDPSGLKIEGEIISVGSIGKKVALGQRVVGTGGMIKVELRQLNHANYAALAPWSTTTPLQLVPPYGSDLYTFSKPLTLHPIQNGTDTTEDLVFTHACPTTLPGTPARDGSKDDVFDIEFMLFPDRTALSTDPTNISIGTLGH